MSNQERALFRFNDVPVVARPSFWLMPFLLWGLLVWLAGKSRPGRSLPQRLLLGALATPIPLSADIGHALAHTVSARLANAPMDRIRLAADMPRTLYDNNDVPPRTHQIRALGGPIFSALGLLFSLRWRQQTPAGSIRRELATLSCLSHGFIFSGSLAPLPIVDGGTLLKWQLVKQGHTPAGADQTLRRLNLALGGGLLALLALLVALRQRRAPH